MITRGNIVKSLAGHDKDKYYIVLEISDKRVLLVNGKTRKRENPKQKNISHISALNTQLYDINSMTDKKIRRLLQEIALK
ncbi:MAG: KOW domain-containing RNA-binding protein [Clostridia bacterium]|nr:KOW domain-containing RNA-binding protein [Clostridia bacterium]